MDDLPDALERLTARLETLERRVHALEHPNLVSTAPASQQLAATPVAEAGEGLSFASAGGVFSVLGKAMLGIAGAYVLRAVAESSSLPRLVIAAIAIAYAMMWLVWAARVKAGEWLASTIYACTSALILAPLLWELTLRFKVLPVPVTAGLLGAFVIAATTLAWKRDRTPVFWVANLTAAVAALALSIATHRLVPFIASLLLMVLICEYAATRNRQLSIRPLVAAAADLAVWALIFIYSSPPSTRTDYPAIGTAGLLLPGCLLFLIYAASVSVRTTLLGYKITIFETVQALIAFLLAASSVLYFEPQFGAIGWGVVCLLLSAACYAAVFVLFDGAVEGRNYHVFAAWAAGLFLAGSVLCLPPFWLAACLGVAAIDATVMGVRLGRLTLQFHGLVYLAAAVVASGLLDYAFHALAGIMPVRVAGSVWFVSVCALVCYAAGKPCPQESWRQQFLHLVPAALTVCALAALLVQGLLWLAALRRAPEAHHVAFIRTLILCAVALALAFAGYRWRRVELTRIAYATLGLVAAKLLFEDLRLGHLVFIAASIFLFAITLIAVPRMAHRAVSVRRDGAP
jgi:hypothetical protein